MFFSINVLSNTDLEAPVSKTANNFSPKTTISTNRWKPSSCKFIKIKGTVIVLILKVNGLIA
jgi:hypothetical protein